ncbi:hypothetical protein [Sinisalibacter aestuarii]|uniref:Uncharacterized protein n=1 Tax=Sinisalibacter aestuarii TaxID=2949426 RepID=A0ABQ5LT80_9RHOB|nr:hypothetical protein [Sinisalibacter aestuarii]GKY88201.1 hypothetical protein STA1M1_20700 [Sinisalibacter aestuarii]
MTTAWAVIAVLVVGLPSALLAGWLGWRGVPALWPVLVNAVWPALGAALYLAITNAVDEAYRLDMPVVTGLMLGATLTAFSAPLWLGGFWAGRQAKRVRAG